VFFELLATCEGHQVQIRAARFVYEYRNTRGAITQARRMLGLGFGGEIGRISGFPRRARPRYRHGGRAPPEFNGAGREICREYAGDMQEIDRRYAGDRSRPRFGEPEAQPRRGSSWPPHLQLKTSAAGVRVHGCVIALRA